VAGSAALPPTLRALQNRRPPTLRSLLVIVVLAAGFVGWSALVLGSSALDRTDAVLRPVTVRLESGPGQIAAAVAVITWPGVVYLGLCLVAVWAWRRRLRDLAVALVLAAALGWSTATLLRLLFGRQRPDSALDVITTSGFGYPSGHVTAAFVFAVMVASTRVVTRQTTAARRVWMVGGALACIAVAVDRLLMGAHFFSDLVGGALLGSLVAIVALVIADVHVLPDHLVPIPRRTPAPKAMAVAPDDPQPEPPRCAVIFNPAKVGDAVTFRRHVEYELRERGFANTLWLETVINDPGREMTATAVRKDVDLVLGAGGDGTIRMICAGLANSGIPFGLIPAGTGNLLARNLGIPLDERAALSNAFDGETRSIDLVKLTADQREPDYFAVMAGIGIDAVILGSTNSELKKAVGSAAYFLAAAQHANHPSTLATFTVDDTPPFRRRASVMVVGNVGYLQANIPLIPDAQPDDGLLDLMIASPRKPADWVKLTARVLSRTRCTDDRLARFTAKKVTIEVAEIDEYQLDGDTEGTARRLVAEIAPGALTIRVPRQAWPPVPSLALPRLTVRSG